MDVHRAGLAEVGSLTGDRFARWPRGAARLALALLGLLMVLAATAPGYAPPPPPPPKIAATNPAAGAAVRTEDDNDIRLYRVINARLRHGENYYRSATEEQRVHNYPVAPGLTIRLPTLAYVALAVGDRGMIGLGLALLALLLLATYRRLATEPGGAPRAASALALLMVGLSCGLDHRYNVLHEIWAGQLIALSLALHRPGGLVGPQRWGWSVVCAALALAVRELALPYVLLMGADALWHRRRQEAAAWLGLVVLFAVALLMHLHLAAQFLRPGDPVSPSWVTLQGMAGLLYKINNSTPLSLLPLWVSGPLVILALFGWASWDSPLGRTGFLLSGGYALAFALFGRDNNFYWGILIAPLLFMGAAFAPQGLRSLVRQAVLFARPAQTAHA